MHETSLPHGSTLLRLGARRWRERALGLARKAGRASSEDAGMILREALVLLAPVRGAAMRRDGRCARASAGQRPYRPGPDLRMIEALLSANAWDSAALALLPADAAYMLSRGAMDGEHMASVLLPGADDEQTRRGASVALALTGALLAALAAGGDDAPEAGADGESGAARDPAEETEPAMRRFWLN